MPKRFNGSVPRPQSRRFRVSVPDADESVLAWIGAQSDLSASVRSLIREAIERHGYRDATCYPVTQQPRRGRPPKLTEPTELAEQAEPVDQTALTVCDHPIPEQIAAAEPKPEMGLDPEHKAVLNESPDASGVLDDSVNTTVDPSDPSDAMNTVNSASTIEDMLGALR